MARNDLTKALEWIGATKDCPACGQKLGAVWTERYNPATERLDRVHVHCGAGWGPCCLTCGAALQFGHSCDSGQGGI